MKHLLQKAKQQKKAFTFVELLIVLGIIGILVVTLVVAVDFSTDKAKTSGVNNVLKTYETAASKAALQEAGFVDDVTQLANLLNESLDSEFKISIMNDVLTTSATDPWGQTIKIGYSKPEGTVGQLKFVSSGPDMKLGNADDIASTVTFKRKEGSGEVLINHPENGTSHVHTYNQQVQSDEYIVQKGTCKTPSVYYVSCSCGDVGYETFNGIVDPNNHVNTQVSYEYVNGEVHNTNKKCIDCGATIETKEEPHVGENICSLCYGVIHTHAFNQTNIEEKFLHKAATCTSKAVYFYSCSCGKAGTETFEFGSVLAHDYTAQVISNVYLAENATCVQMAKYFYSCTMCGDKGTFTFNYGDFNRDNHVGLTTYEYSRVDENQHMKNSICNACSNVKTSTTELHTMNEMNTCTLCGTHVHVFNKQIASDAYLRDSATCTSKATYFYSCECGSVGSEYFESGEMAPHTYTAEKAEPEYLKSNATCINKPVYYKSCIYCGVKGTDTFEYGDIDSINHIGTTKTKYESISDTQHAKNTVCSSCNAVIESIAEAHVFNANHDCTLCNTHIHVFDKQVVDNKYLKSEATCVAKAVYYYSCKCGEAGTTVFEYGNITDHIFTAEVPSEEYLKTAATCIDQAVYYRSCTGCGLKGTTVFTVDGYDANNHVGAEIYAGTKEVHSKYSCCGATISTVHSYTKTTEIPATCIAMGTSRYTCDCTYTYTAVDISINPNNHVGQIVYGGTKDVHTKYDCCNATVSSTHTYDQNVIDDKYFASAANCVDKAAYYKSCKCGYSNESATFTVGSVDSSSHKGPEVYGGTQTCHIKCEACGVTLQGEDYHEMKVVPGGISATCTSDGTVIYGCDCGYGYTTTVDKLGHAPASDATWSSDHETATVVCTRNGCTASWSGNSTVNVISNATCTSADTYNHKATFSVDGTTKTFTCPETHSGSALGHIISNPPQKITWSNDNKQVTIHCERSGCNQTWTYNLVDCETEITDVVNATCTTTGSYKCIIKVTIDSKEYSFKCPGHTTAALGHAPATTATWNSDHSVATVACTRSDCSQTWSGNSVQDGLTPAACVSANTYNHKATFDVDGTTKTFTCSSTHSGGALGHLPSTTATWNSDHSVATVVCTRSGCTASWSGNSVKNGLTPAACVSINTYNHKATFDVNGTTETFTCSSTHSGSALGHLPATTATWNSDHSVATVACTRSGCSQTWSGNSTVNAISNATCTSANTYNHQATFSVDGTTKTFICPITHSGSTHSHTWSYECDTVCNCCSCTRTASHNMQQTKAPTCIATGTNTCSYGCGTIETIAALGHDYTKTKSSYSWSTDHTSCTGTRPCGRSGCSYVFTENATVTKRDTTTPTCTTEGKHDYHASFATTTLFSARSCPDWHYTDALGHAPATKPTWNSEHSMVTVRCTRNDCTASWSGNSTKKVTTSATCSVAEKYQHTATFSVDGTTKTFTCTSTHTGSTHSHQWSYTCDTSCNCCGCSRSASHNMQQTKAPTCTATGTKKCSYGCGKTETIAALGHIWQTTKYPTCVDTGSKKCSRCNGTATIAATGKHTKPSGQKQYPTCTENVCCTVCGTELVAKLTCGSTLHYIYSQNWWQGLWGNCIKYEACANGNRSDEPTCNKVYNKIGEVKCTCSGDHWDAKDLVWA